MFRTLVVIILKVQTYFLPYFYKISIRTKYNFGLLCRALYIWVKTKHIVVNNMCKHTSESVQPGVTSRFYINKVLHLKIDFVLHFLYKTLCDMCKIFKSNQKETKKAFFIYFEVFCGFDQLIIWPQLKDVPHFQHFFSNTFS